MPSTLKNPVWYNSTVLKGEVVNEISELTHAGGIEHGSDGKRGARPCGATELEDRLIAQGLGGDPVGWFERFYHAAEVERWNCFGAVPNRPDCSPAGPKNASSTDQVLRHSRRLRRGADADYVARLGFQVVAFEIAGTGY